LALRGRIQLKTMPTVCNFPKDNFVHIELGLFSRALDATTPHTLVHQRSCDCNAIVAMFSRGLTNGLAGPLTTYNGAHRQRIINLVVLFARRIQEVNPKLHPITVNQWLLKKKAKLAATLFTVSALNLKVSKGNYKMYENLANEMYALFYGDTRHVMDDQKHIIMQPPKSWLRRYAGNAPMAKGQEPLKDAKNIDQSNSFTGQFPNNKLTKPTRAIIPASPRINLVTAQYTAPFEAVFYNVECENYREFFPYGTGRVVAKGLNGRERAELCIIKTRTFCLKCVNGEYVILKFDQTNFDANLDEFFIWLEWVVLQLIYTSHAGYIGILMDQYITLKMYHRCFKAMRIGGRGSGHMTTGLMNTFWTVILTVLVFRLIEITLGIALPWDMLCDGDDNCVCVPKTLAQYVIKFSEQFYSDVGFILKVEGQYTDVMHMEFCQSFIMPIVSPTHTYYKFICNPNKCLWRSLGHTRHINPRYPDYAIAYVSTLMRAWSIYGAGVPIFRVLDHLSQGQTRKTIKLDINSGIVRRLEEDADPTATTQHENLDVLLAFCHRFGHPLGAVLEYEQEILRTPIDWVQRSLEQLEDEPI